MQALGAAPLHTTNVRQQNIPTVAAEILPNLLPMCLARVGIDFLYARTDKFPCWQGS